MSDETETGDGGGVGWPDPEQRKRRAEPSGVPVTLGDGREWVLVRPGMAPALADARDRLYDDLVLRRMVRTADVLFVAWVLLAASYDLAEHEVEALVTGADPKGLTNAVLEAVFGPERPRRTYSTWVLSAFAANGIDPAKVSPRLVPEVMTQLVAAGRALPEERYVDSASAREQRRLLPS